ncbi:hypothetical protein KI659_00140 [Litoribacter alkaliphilus]|uniref:Uncharacterized protein n=1 Tax=Litoribacter ruber TaxID=702568 RepID=A0AAP2G3E7_9BACT|nr:hypothetical protein [Litoribacter alkaliphilus]MBS9522413.1 hypothetical protein [Litoribacter alkaliphilus]
MVEKLPMVEVLGTWHLVLGTWYLVLGTWYLVLVTPSNPLNNPETHTAQLCVSG